MESDTYYRLLHLVHQFMSEITASFEKWMKINCLINEIQAERMNKNKEDVGNLLETGFRGYYESETLCFSFISFDRFSG